MKKKILCLAMTVIMAAGVHTTAFAKDYQGADGWQVNFTGGKMESNFENKTVSDELATIQPGDSIELKVQLKNSDKGETTPELNITYKFPEGNDKPEEFNIVVIQECTPVLYDKDGNPYADWNHVITTEDSKTTE